MKAVVLTKSGKPEVLKISEIAEPHPGFGEVKVKLDFIGMNYADVLSRKGLYQWAVKRPYVMGMEGFGIIEELGEGVTGKKIGDPVIVAAQYGAYAEKIVVPEAQALTPLPHLSAEENAAFAVQWMTAWVGLFEMSRLRASDTVLIQAAAGGVGTAGVQLAKALGCTVYGTVGSDEKIEIVNRLGIDGAINYRQQDFYTEVKRLTNDRGVDVVIEVVGGDVFKKSVNLLAPFGRIVVIGFASNNLKKWNPISIYKTLRDIPRVKVTEMGEQSFSFGASHLGYMLRDTPRMLRVWNDLSSFATEHELKPLVGHVYDFEDLHQAHHLMESRGSTGKIVLKM